MLNKKAKEDFEKWYLDPIQKKIYKTISNLGCDKAIMLDWFSLSDSHRYGVLVDWFDSVGIEILISKDYDYENNIDINAYIFHIDNHESNDFKSYPTRTQARQKAIEKANEIYNNRV